MSYDLYWHGDPEAVRSFREADRLSYKRQDYEAWLQGRYVYDALIEVSPLYMTFAKNHKPKPYAEKPFTQIAEDQKRQKSLEQRLKNGEWVAKQIAAKIDRWEQANQQKPNNRG